MNSWLDPILQATDTEVLVLCRTGASVRAVLREIGAGHGGGGRGGFAGLRVSTLSGFVRSALPCELVPAQPAEEPFPAEHPWEPLLRDRPRLTSLLRSHVERARLAVAVGQKLDDMEPNLCALVASGWAPTALATHAARILASSRPERVFAVGFEGAAAPFEHAVLTALDARPLLASPFRAPAPIRTRRLPDVSAEARAIVAEILAHPDVRAERVLVLVPDAASEERVRSALLRNGVEVGDDGASPLKRHALAALLVPLLPAFASRGSEPVHGEDLLRLLVTPVLAHTPPRGGIVPVPGVDAQRASVRQMRAVIAGCGRVFATIGDWGSSIARIEARAEQNHDAATPDEKPGTASRLVATRIVRARVAAVALHTAGTGTLRDVGRLIADLKLVYDEFTQVVPLYQVIVTALECLAAGEAAASVLATSDLAERVKQRAARLRHALSAIPSQPVPVAATVARTTRLPRLWRRWTPILTRCVAILGRRPPKREQGDTEEAGALVWVINTARLWERLVEASLERILDNSGTIKFKKVLRGVKEQIRCRSPWEEVGNQFKDPDFLVARPTAFWVLDAKYKVLLALSELSPDDQYQLFAYSLLSERSESRRPSHAAVVRPVGRAEGRGPGRDARRRSYQLPGIGGADPQVVRIHDVPLPFPSKIRPIIRRGLEEGDQCT